MINRDAVRHVYGTDVYSTDGDKIGSAGQVYLDNSTGEPAWVAVRTGLFGKKEAFVPIQDATLDGDRLEVPFSKDKVKHAPHVDHDRELSPDDEDELYRYYGDDPGRTSDDHDAEHPSGHSGDDRDAERSSSHTGHDRDAERSSSHTGHDRDAEHPSGHTDDDRDAERSSGGDDAMTRSEERLVPHTRTEQTGKARLRKYTVTEEQQVTVPVTREEVRLEQEPAPDTTARRADDAPGEQDPEMTLWAERPVVTTEAVPVERVRMHKQTVADTETVSGEVRKERIELDEERSH